MSIETFAASMSQEKYGTVARLGRNGINKLTSLKAVAKSEANGFSARDHMTTTAHIDRLFANAEKVEDQQERSGDVNIRSVGRYAAPILLNGDYATAYLTLKNTKRYGHNIYSVELMEIKKELSGLDKRLSKENTLITNGSYDNMASRVEKINSVSEKLDENFEPKQEYFNEYDSRGVQPVRNAKGQRLAPNGKVSNLNESQWFQVRTPEFKKWFGDWENDAENASKVVDENGEPLVVYHSSDSDFNSFDIAKGWHGGL